MNRTIEKMILYLLYKIKKNTLICHITMQSLQVVTLLVSTLLTFAKPFVSVPASSLENPSGVWLSRVNNLQNLYQDSKCAVRTNDDTSEWFNVQTGVSLPTTACLQ